MTAPAERIAPLDEYETYVTKAKPVLKWVGGKAQLEEPIIKAIDRMHPEVIETYYEPFAGGLAIFFALRRRFRIKQAVISDTNEELINFYLQIQNEPEALILALRKLKKEGHGGEARYYTVRASRPRTPAARAARFRYINAEGYNGLWRVNKKNECNVPWGRRVKPAEICHEEAIWAAHHAFAMTTIEVASFRQMCSVISRDDGAFTYFDPPYWPTRPTANFTSYTSEDFGKVAQYDLMSRFSTIAYGRGSALLSNSNVPETRDLYRAFRKQKLQARRNVNSVGTGRGAVSELLIESTFRE